jgi:hypothetical protein
MLPWIYWWAHLKCDSIYEKRISADCIAYGTEETANAYFGFVLRETHNAKRGGAPDVTPSIDRTHPVNIERRYREGTCRTSSM